MEESRQAATQGKSVNGIKGPSWFGGLKHHDIVDGTGINYMHFGLLGVSKCLLGFWFDSGETTDYKISSRISEVDARLTSIKPPKNISRVPRSIENHRKYFKASELRSFLCGISHTKSEAAIFIYLFIYCPRRVLAQRPKPEEAP